MLLNIMYKSLAFVVLSFLLATTTTTTTTTNAFTTTTLTPALSARRGMRSNSPLSQKSHSPIVTRKKTFSRSTALCVASEDSVSTLVLEQLIGAGVPAAVSIVTIIIVVKMILSTMKKSRERGRPDRDNLLEAVFDDLYVGDEGDDAPFSRNNLLFPNKRSRSEENLGIPKKLFLKVAKLNDKLDAYKYSFSRATKSYAQASADYQTQTLQKALLKGMDSSVAGLTVNQTEALLKLEGNFLKQAHEIQDRLSVLEKDLAATAIHKEFSDPKYASVFNETKGSAAASGSGDPKKLFKDFHQANKDLLQLETYFVGDLMYALGAGRANGIRAAILGNGGRAGSIVKALTEHPLSKMLMDVGNTENRTKSLFVMRFDDDDVKALREQVTGIVRGSLPGDEALVIVKSTGGSTPAYGLATSQLKRLKEKGLKLTVCVEEYAASKGYMMCCVADRLVASPFALLGDIGISGGIFNYYERLKDEGIEFQTVTAGKYKRTITGVTKVTREAIEKETEKANALLELFKEVIRENRPSIDLEMVATGESWYGTAALDRKLCDALKPADDVLMEYVDKGYNVYEVSYAPEDERTPSLSELLGASVGNGEQMQRKGLLGSIVGWLVRTVAPDIGNIISGAVLDETGSSALWKGRNVLDFEAEGDRRRIAQFRMRDEFLQ